MKTVKAMITSVVCKDCGSPVILIDPTNGTEFNKHVAYCANPKCQNHKEVECTYDLGYWDVPFIHH